MNIGDSLCINENILYFWVVVWFYLLIKDVGYIIKGELVCSVLWGSLCFILSLEYFDKKWILWEGVWFFGIKFMDDIFVNGYIFEGIMVILLLFVFR